MSLSAATFVPTQVQELPDQFKGVQLGIPPPAPVT